MFEVADEVLAALRSSGQSGRVWGVAQYQDRQADLRLDQAGSVTFSGTSAEAQAATDVLVFGNRDSLVPKSRTDLLAPYGQEVSLFRDVTVRNRTYTIPLGVFRVTGNSDAVETIRETSVAGREAEEAADSVYPVGDGLYSVNTLMVEASPGLYESVHFTEDPPGSGLFVPGSRVSLPGYSSADVVSWQVRVELVDRLRLIARAKIIGAESYPLPGNTVWDELRRLVPFPVVESMPDIPVPSGVTYEDRPGAVKLLCDALGGVPAVTREGAFTVRQKDRWADATLTPVFDIEGTISWSDGQSDDFYNFVWAHSDDGEFSAFAALNDDSNPLSVNRAGMSSYEHSSPLYKSNLDAERGAQTILKRLLGTRSRQVKVECLPEAILLDLGDVGWVRDPVQGRAVIGEVVEMDVPLDPTEPVRLTLTVAEVA